MMRRTGDAEAAADLTAETFATAIVARRRFRPGVAPAGAWLLAIAHRKLVDYQRRGFAEERARRRLAMERRPLAEEDTALIRALGEEVTLDRWKQLPADQRAAIQARVLDERPYPEIASELGTSETAVRMRVSRGLASLRGRLRTGDERGLHQRPARRPRRGDGPLRAAQSARTPRGRALPATAEARHPGAYRGGRRPHRRPRRGRRDRRARVGRRTGGGAAGREARRYRRRARRALQPRRTGTDGATASR